MNNLFPVFLKLENLRILLVGGGKTGLEKITAVIKNSPATEVTIVAKEILPAIELLALDHPNIKVKRREFYPGDLYNVNLVIAATGNRELSERIRQEAEKRNILVNVADTPDLCDFYLGSIVAKGDLKIAISTNGKSPVLAKRLRQYFEENLPDTQALIENLYLFRSKLKGDFSKKVRELNELTSSLIKN
jgi:siroheme synthase-like protein